MKKNRSFTLIELLVVIAILAGFMALLVPNFMSVREKSRDMKRKSDLKSIQKAFELYSQNQNPHAYPSGIPLTPCQALKDNAGVTYMQAFPIDPLLQCSTATSHYYFLQPTDAPDSPDKTKYTLGACIEGKNDPDTTPCPEGFMSNTNGSCGGNCYLLTEP